MVFNMTSVSQNEPCPQDIALVEDNICCSGSQFARVSKSSNVAVTGTSNPTHQPPSFSHSKDKGGAESCDFVYPAHQSPTGVPSLRPCFIVCFNCENISTTLIS